MTLEIRNTTAEDIPQASWIEHEAFRSPMREERWLRSGRGLFENGNLRAIVLIENEGQFFGGQVVPAAVISAMAVVPEHRGRGLGAFLIRQVIEECRRQGVALALHYPRVSSTYRRVGFEFAGGYIRYSMPIGVSASMNGPRIQPWDDDDLDEVMACYESFARQTNGLLRRSREWWLDRVLATSSSEHLYRYCTRVDGKITGYLVYVQDPIASHAPYLFRMNARDFVWLDATAAQTLLGFIGHSAPLGQDFTWSGPVDEPLFAFLDTRLKHDVAYRWMMRLIDVQQALSTRGYMHGVEASTELTISDAMVPDNNRSFRFEVHNGAADVSVVPSAGMRADIGVVAALYSGWLSARDAARLGRLQGATEADIRTLDLIFAGTKPWLMEMV